MEEIFFAKVKDSAIIPKKREEDGCYDVYANFEEQYLIIMPCEIKLIPTGIASSCSSKYRFALRERGSSGTKGLSYKAGQIDSGYRGEWFVPINNTSNKPILITKCPEKYDKIIQKCVTIYPYSKAICQVALEEVPKVLIKEIPYNDLLQINSDRGTGALGSSNK